MSKSTNIGQCIDQLKMLYGIRPYHGPNNYAQGDPYFGMSIRQEFTEETIAKAEERIKNLREKL